jgi:hypothetical protein
VLQHSAQAATLTLQVNHIMEGTHSASDRAGHSTQHPLTMLTELLHGVRCRCLMLRHPLSQASLLVLLSLPCLLCPLLGALAARHAA